MLLVYWSPRVAGQLVDRKKAPNAADEGIARAPLGFPYPSQIGEGRSGGDRNASLNVIALIPFAPFAEGASCFNASSRGTRAKWH